MAVSRLEAFLPHPVETVWRIVTDYADCGWRSDLERVETHGAGDFTEYAKGGYALHRHGGNSVPPVGVPAGKRQYGRRMDRRF